MAAEVSNKEYRSLAPQITDQSPKETPLFDAGAGMLTPQRSSHAFVL